MTFERVGKMGQSVAATSPPTLAIYPNASGRFNATAGAKWFDDSGVDTVELYVDVDAERIGIARGGSGEDAFSLHYDDPGYTVALRSTLGQFGITVADLEETIYLDVEHDPSEGLLIADATPLLEAAEGGDR